MLLSTYCNPVDGLERISTGKRSETAKLCDQQVLKQQRQRAYKLQTW
jgi:hypothetical protein